MRIDERLFLNPLHKWVKFGRPPVKFVLHLLLLVFVTLQAKFYLHRDINHASSSAQHFSQLFAGISEGTRVLLEPEVLRNSVADALHNIFGIESVTFNDVFLTSNGVDPGDSVLLSMTQRNGSSVSLKVSREDLQTTTKDLLKRKLPMLFDVRLITVQSVSVNFLLLEQVHAEPCKLYFLWNITTNFNGHQVGRFIAGMQYTMGTVKPLAPCTDDVFTMNHTINVSVIVLSSLACALVLRKTLRSLLVLVAVRQRFRNEPSPLSMEDQLVLFNWWWGVSLAGHAAQMAATAKCMHFTLDVTTRMTLLGWSAFLTWLNICQYFESFPGYYVTFSTTSKGMASVCRYMASVMPILTAFMFLGTCSFWKAANFACVSSTFCSLFSLLNGDMVHDAFVDLGSVAGWGGHAYLYVFIFIFIYIVLNVNISIIEEAFFKARFEGDHYEHAIVQTSPSRTPMVRSRAGSRDAMNAARNASSDSLAEPFLRRVSPSGMDGTAAIHELGTMAAEELRLPQEAFTTGASQGTPSVRGRMKPQFVDNGRVQGALAATFPYDYSRPRSAEGSSRHNGERLDASPEASSFLASPLGATSAAGSRVQRIFSAADASPTSRDQYDFWMEMLPQWTNLLRTVPLPHRGEVDEQRWSSFVRTVSWHIMAANDAAASIYRVSTPKHSDG